MPGRERSARVTAAAFTNWGRAPTTLTILTMWFPGLLGLANRCSEKDATDRA